jgi:hypothetical protein
VIAIGSAAGLEAEPPYFTMALAQGSLLAELGQHTPDQEAVSAESSAPAPTGSS